MASKTAVERSTTVLPHLESGFPKNAAGTIPGHRFVKVGSGGTVTVGTFNDPVIGVNSSHMQRVSGQRVDVGIGKCVVEADGAITAGQAIKCGTLGRAIQYVDSDLSGDTIEDNVGLEFTNQPSNDGVEILSDNAGDVQVATVYGTTTGTDTVVAEPITLTGTVAVSTVKVDWGVILGVKVASAAVGTITFREASGNAAITTIAPAALSSGIIAVTAGQTNAYNTFPTAVASGASTKQIGLIGTDESGAALLDSQALNGTTAVTMNEQFKAVTHLLVGDPAAATTVTVKVGAEDSRRSYAGIALETATAQGDVIEARVP